MVYSSPSLLSEMASGQRYSAGLYTVAYVPSDSLCPHIFPVEVTNPCALFAGVRHELPPSLLMVVSPCFHSPTFHPSGSV